MQKGIFSATALITATTIDDAIWLIPYITSSHIPLSTKVIHGVTFVLTLEILILCCIGMNWLLKYGLILYFNADNNNDDEEDEKKEENEEEIMEYISFIMQIIGIGLCWCIAIFLYIKKMMKKRKLKQKQLLLGEHSLLLSSSQTQQLQSSSIDEEYNDDSHNNTDTINDDDDDDDMNTIPTTPSISLVISFTALGALDEISYFPALIMGKIFTPIDLCIGALLAAILILGVITLFLSQCKPLVDLLDRIPLYGIVGMFAIVLTAGLFF